MQTSYKLLTEANIYGIARISDIYKMCVNIN